MCVLDTALIPAFQALGKTHNVVGGKVHLISSQPSYRVSIRELSGVPRLKVIFRPFVTVTDDTKASVYETALPLNSLTPLIKCELNLQTREIVLEAELPLLSGKLTAPIFASYFQYITELFLLCLFSLNRARWGGVSPEAAVWNSQLVRDLEEILEKLSQ